MHSVSFLEYCYKESGVWEGVSGAEGNHVNIWSWSWSLGPHLFGEYASCHCQHSSIPVYENRVSGTALMVFTYIVIL